jgi:hypothetical protein
MHTGTAEQHEDRTYPLEYGDCGAAVKKHFIAVGHPDHYFAHLDLATGLVQGKWAKEREQQTSWGPMCGVEIDGRPATQPEAKGKRLCFMCVEYAEDWLEQNENWLKEKEL